MANLSKTPRISLGILYGGYGTGPGGTPATLSDADGRFAIKYLTPQRTYKLQIDADGFNPDKRDVPYKPGEAICDLGEIRIGKMKPIVSKGAPRERPAKPPAPARGK